MSRIGTDVCLSCMLECVWAFGVCFSFTFVFEVFLEQQICILCLYTTSQNFAMTIFFFRNHSNMLIIMFLNVCCLIFFVETVIPHTLDW